MILYVNGDSHTAAAEACVPHAFAEDDPALGYLGRVPHPANLAVSWGSCLADTLKMALKCDAEAASSNDRILRTTRAWLSRLQTPASQVLMIIQWSTWEREEWLWQGRYLQITSSGTDHVPPQLADRYREFVINIDWNKKTLENHEKIWQLHQELTDRGLRHVFFNGNSNFAILQDIRYGLQARRQNWGASYVGPYSPEMTWDKWLRGRGHCTVSPDSWHFDQRAHSDWARFMLQYCIDNNLVP